MIDPPSTDRRPRQRLTRRGERRIALTWRVSHVDGAFDDHTSRLSPPQMGSTIGENTDSSRGGRRHRARTAHPPREDLRDGTAPHQGGYRCRPSRFKIILGDPGTAEAPSMSAADRVVLLILGLSVTAYVTSSEIGTDVTGPFDPGQEGQGSNPAALGKSVLSQPEEPSFSFIEPTVVTIQKRAVALGQHVVPRGRDAIGRELQKELKRVGCYAGELNGVWTTSTRQAMKAFTERVNAKLPTNEPDSILLALVQGHPNRVCGAPCPWGQGLSRTLQCTPNALLARTIGTKLTSAPGQRLAQVASAWTVKTIAIGGVPDPPAPTGHPDHAAPVEPPLSSAAPPQLEPAPRRITRKHGVPPARHERAWASNFFKRQDRLSLN